ncbi:MAG: hypothetical protein SFV19_16705 [Rhodospirillaceae bacterium]|nr:hypothetical protein [Rhodospirillaceae bacterium]
MLLIDRMAAAPGATLLTQTPLTQMRRHARIDLTRWPPLLFAQAHEGNSDAF